MKNTIGCVGHEEGTAACQADRFQRLAHDLRQPLSSIECIGFYLDLVLGVMEPELHAQCETLRRLVQQAHWMLEDTALALSCEGAECGAVPLAPLFERLNEQAVQRDSGPLDLRLAGEPVVWAPLRTAGRFCEHALSFVRLVTSTAAPGVFAATVGEEVRLEISVAAEGDLTELLQMLEPPRGAGLQAFLEAAGGAMAARADGQRLTLSFCLPRGEPALRAKAASGAGNGASRAAD